MNKPLSVLVAGGGVAAIEAVLALQALAGELVEVTLLAPTSEFRYRPLAVTEPFDARPLPALPLETVADDAGARLRAGALDHVDADRREAWTTSGECLHYDLLLVATGAQASDSVPGAMTFWAWPGVGSFSTLLEGLRSGAVQRVVFAVPGGATWPLPLYEVALLTTADLASHEAEAKLVVLTPEEAPLAVFGAEASAAVAAVLEERGIRVLTRRRPISLVDGELAVGPEGSVAADAVVTLPVLTGPAFDGLPHDRHGFVPTDVSGVVDDVAAVFAAGDVTTFPIKQGGIATQQADAAAQTIAVHAGARLPRAEFRPILRGRLLTGGPPLYLRAELYGGRGDTSTASTEALWWPPGKIFGRYLGPYLASRARALAPV
jgi:sulfide:quinone oxidoreductase